jgi:hypothetical protein
MNNGSPLLYNRLIPFPDEAKIPKDKYFELRTSMILENNLRYFEGDGWEIYTDFEARRVPIEIRFNLLKRIQLSALYQCIYITGGFTDEIVSRTHQIIHFTGRKEHSNLNHFNVKFMDQDIFNLDERAWGFYESVYGLKFNIIDPSEQPFGMSFKLLYKKPIRHEDTILISEDEDIGCSILIDFKIKKVTTHINFGQIIAQQNKNLKPLEVDGYYFLYLTTQYEFTSKFSGYMQLSVFQNPYRRNDVFSLQENPMEAIFGIGYRLTSNLNMQVGVSEDLSDMAPDVGFNLTLIYSF